MHETLELAKTADRRNGEQVVDELAGKFRFVYLGVISHTLTFRCADKLPDKTLDAMLDALLHEIIEVAKTDERVATEVAKANSYGLV